MKIQEFTATIARAGSKTILPIPFNPNETWGDKLRHHITGTINGVKFRGPIEFDRSQFFLSLGAAWCRNAGLEAGEKAEVRISPEGPQLEDLSPDIVGALEGEPQARAFFEALATFYRTGYIKWIEGARRPESRAARIGEMIGLLKAGKKQK